MGPLLDSSIVLQSVAPAVDQMEGWTGKASISNLGINDFHDIQQTIYLPRAKISLKNPPSMMEESQGCTVQRNSVNL